jgi:hypothetical protein
MAKAPIVKFPRISAGFYTITLEGELVGYVAKKVDGKEVTWTIYNTNEPDLTLETLPTSAIVEETELFREAKENAKVYFLNRPEPQEQEQEVETVELQVPDWSEDETPDFFDELNEYEEAEAELAGVF